MPQKFLKPLHDKSMKTNLMALVNFCEQEAATEYEYDKDGLPEMLKRRREAFVKIGQYLKKLADGRYVNRLMDYME